MLVLSRKVGERILVGENIWVTVVDIRGDKVRIGIDAPGDTPIKREELLKLASNDATPDVKEPEPTLAASA